MWALRRHGPSPAADRVRSATTLTRLLPLLAVMALLLALVSVAHAQEATTDTSSDPDQADDPPLALQPDGQDLNYRVVACLQTPLTMPRRA